MAPQRRNDEAKVKERKGPSLLEWLSAAVGAVLSIGILVFIGLGAVQPNADGPPVLDVRPLSVGSHEGIHVVELEVANRTGETAASVQIEGELKQAGSTVETSSATISYVPGHSQRRAGLFFTRDPRRYSLEVRATGYERP